MKIQYIFSLVLLFVLSALSQFLYAESYEYKTTLMKDTSITIPARTIDGCNGGSDFTIPAQNYTAVKIMKTPFDFTVVSFRVYHSDNLSTVLYSYMSKPVDSINFNSTSGEISYRMYGIAQTRKELTVRVYLNDGTGPVYEEQKFFTSQAKTGPPVGSIMPFYGTAAAAAALELGGWFLCDGRAISSISNDVVFPDEKTVLQDVINSPNLPDLRGLFLRGIDPAGTYDPTANRAPGNVQTSQIQGHTHDYDRANNSTASANANVGLSTPTGLCSSGPFAVLVPTASTTGGDHSHTINHTQTATTSAGSGGNDTRPTNAAVNYLIKVRH